MAVDLLTLQRRTLLDTLGNDLDHLDAIHMPALLRQDIHEVLHAGPRFQGWWLDETSRLSTKGLAGPHPSGVSSNALAARRGSARTLGEREYQYALPPAFRCAEDRVLPRGPREEEVSLLVDLQHDLGAYAEGGTGQAEPRALLLHDLQKETGDPAARAFFRVVKAFARPAPKAGREFATVADLAPVVGAAPADLDLVVMCVLRLCRYGRLAAARWSEDDGRSLSVTVEPRGEHTIAVSWHDKSGESSIHLTARDKDPDGLPGPGWDTVAPWLFGALPEMGPAVHATVEAIQTSLSSYRRLDPVRAVMEALTAEAPEGA